MFTKLEFLLGYLVFTLLFYIFIFPPFLKWDRKRIAKRRAKRAAKWAKKNANNILK